ncbi:hypothetical protein BS78_05G070000 [Paspalum vaginatum]|nr:hypothetical protein BS78_05G070000 [Paspalum vaginatum]
MLPALVDLPHVKKLNWAKFVVDQLKEATSKMDKRNFVKGYLLFLMACQKYEELHLAKGVIAKLLIFFKKKNKNHDVSDFPLRRKDQQSFFSIKMNGFRWGMNKMRIFCIFYLT